MDKVVGGILWFYGNFVSQQEWKYIKKIVHKYKINDIIKQYRSNRYE